MTTPTTEHGATEAFNTLCTHSVHVAEAAAMLARAVESGHITRIVSAAMCLRGELDILAGVLGPHARAGHTIAPGTVHLTGIDSRTSE